MAYRERIYAASVVGLPLEVVKWSTRLAMKEYDFRWALQQVVRARLPPQWLQVTLDETQKYYWRSDFEPKTVG